MCICSFLPSVSSIFVCRSFLLIYSIRLRLSLQLPLSSLNFFSLVTCFLVMNALFNFVLCLLHLLLPLPPCFFVFFLLWQAFYVIFPSFCYYDCYSYNCFYHRRFWPSSYYFKVFVICIKDRLLDRHLCLNLYPCVIKVQSVSPPQQSRCRLLVIVTAAPVC